MFFLYWNDKDPRYDVLDGVRIQDKIVKARYNTLEEAKAQAEHDIEHGKRILRIEDEDGKEVWTP